MVKIGKIRAVDLAFGAVFICLMAIGANITVWFPFLAVPIGGATVPISLQTFFAILAGFILGHRLGLFTMVAYMLLGFAGLPIFANLSAGPMALISPTGGFIIAFIFVAYITGLIVQRQRNKRSIPTYTFASFIGLAVNYIIGVSYMYLAMNIWLEIPITYKIAWISMIPFLIKDSILSILAVVFIVSLAKRLPDSLSHRYRAQ